MNRTSLKPPPRPLRILLVEDEVGDVRLMQLAIRHSGYPAECDDASDGRQALCFLRRQASRLSGAARPDLILIDLKMPGQSGLDFLAAVKQDEDLCAIPVVVVSSSLVEADICTAYQLGAAGYIQKPADLRDFASAVAALLEYWFRLVQLPQNGE